MSLEIAHKIEINSSRENLWKIIMNFPEYGKWNPFLTKVERINDDTLKITAKMGKSDTVFLPKILNEEPNRELRWKGMLFNIPFLFTGQHFFTLKEEKDQTVLVHGEKFSGIFAYLLWIFIRKDIENNFKSLEAALKKEAEK